MLTCVKATPYSEASTPLVKLHAEYTVINKAVVSFVLSDDSNLCCGKMIYQVLINFNDKRNKPLEVADSEENFNKTTVLELKKKFKDKIAPGAPGRLNSRLFYIMHITLS